MAWYRYLHAGVSAERFAAITKLGAQAVRAGSNYEESIDICKAESKAKGFTIVQDVSWSVKQMPIYIYLQQYCESTGLYGQ